MDFELLFAVFACTRYFVDINTVYQFTKKRRGKAIHTHKAFDCCNKLLLADLHRVNFIQSLTVVTDLVFQFQLFRFVLLAELNEYNIEWDGRDYDPENFESGTPVNQALTAGNVCLYGLAHAVIFALGCSAGLGFVHVGHENSFVYDIADLYKAEIVIPLAFEVAAQDPPELPSVMRRRVRDRMVEANLLERMVKDIKYLLKESQDTQDTQDALYLWDNARDVLPGGRSY